MKKIIPLLLLSVMPTAWAGAQLTDEQAKDMALRMLLSIDQAQKNYAVALDKRDADLYRAKVHDVLQAQVGAWPKVHLDNRAIFPYFECRQAADDYRNFTQITFSGKAQPKLQAHYKTQFENSYKGCRSSIEHPDMSLKNIS